MLKFVEMKQCCKYDRCDSAHSPSLYQALFLGIFQIAIKAFLLVISVEMHWGFLKPLQ